MLQEGRVSAALERSAAGLGAIEAESLFEGSVGAKVDGARKKGNLELLLRKCLFEPTPHFQGNIYIFNKPDDQSVAIAQTTANDCIIESVTGKGQNLHRLAIIIKDGKKIDVSLCSREEQEQWVTNIREFQTSVPTLQLPQLASLHQ